jgi:hypothetical protein
MTVKLTDRAWSGILVALLFGALLIAMAASQGCTPCGEAGALQCRGTVVRVCSPDGAWRVVSDCSATDPGRWVCGEVDGVPACVPEEEVDND